MAVRHARTPRRRVGALALALVLTGPVRHAAATAPATAATTILDDFNDLSGWTTSASEGAHVWLLPEPGATGMGMRIGYDLSAGGGWVIVRKAFSLSLPRNFAFTFALRGEGRANNFEFKLLDGKNVWWRVQRDLVPPPEWQPVTIRKSRLDFAWGPAGGGEPRQMTALELAISVGEGGSGTLWIDDLALEEREPATHDGTAPDVTASTSVAGHEPALLVDPDLATAWRSDALPAEQWVTLDLHRNCEFGGLVIDWEPADRATAYTVQVSTDGSQWTTAYTVVNGSGARDYVYMPDAESRYVKLVLLRSSRGQGYGIRGVAVQPIAFSASPNQFFAAIARDAPPGSYPKYLAGRQTYWTEVGLDGDGKEALLNEEGMLEVDKGAFSVEPFLYVGGALVTWQDVTTSQELEDGYLPIPSVIWRHDHLSLRVTAFAGGKPGASILYARYRLDNHGDREEPVRLFLAVRPFQVNPPWQSLNMTGGTSPIQQLRYDGRVVWVNRDKAVVPLPAPDAFGVVTFEQGAITDFLRAGRIPPHTDVTDAFGFASGALDYALRVAPGGSREVALAIPFHDPYLGSVAGLRAGDGQKLVAAEQAETRRHWETVLGRVDIELPPPADKIARSMKTTLAYTLINRDGPALQPGSRNYARSWIRDGAITVGALLEMGCTEEARQFLRWFAGHQAADGRVPCCIDRRGADPVSENDSPGLFVYGIMEYYRFTHDIGFLSDLWPHVVRAVDYLASLRTRRMTEEFRTPEKEVFFGLLPESISHEGYATHPVHSYWDDFFALRGLKDAAAMAVVMGDTERATRFAALRDGFRETLYASITRTLKRHGIDYLPGSVELGDFDPTSTAIALTPGGEQEHLPGTALARTFERYWAEFETRRAGTTPWEAYSPYEVRNVGAFLRLGQKDRALALLDWVVADQRPPGWNEWAEISWRDREAPRFIGDMPHTWVGAGFIRSVRSLLAYEREADRALVLAAGVRPEWVTSGQGVAVTRLPTHYGVLHYRLQAESADTVHMRMWGDLAMPPGGIVIQSPLPQPLTGVTVNGRPVESFGPDRVLVGAFPADVVLRYGADPGAGPSDAPSAANR